LVALLACSATLYVTTQKLAAAAASGIKGGKLTGVDHIEDDPDELSYVTESLFFKLLASLLYK